MPAAVSAGILLYRRRGGALELLLVHPGGPYWAKRDAGAWQIPKGGIEPGESAVAAALREFTEELGTRPPGDPVPLGIIRQAGGKMVEAFALAGDLDCGRIESVTFELQWPPRSGRMQHFPEVDRAAWFTVAAARAAILPSQAPLIDLLEGLVGGT
ncbi:NUDIX domain-containing protein [Sphingomonas naphthae]|uniref:NUDIX domain-containing protein n=1 Tax=Sphingomonas naphthae TaxID=1813468 RepID=A0ABY7TL15_9SPHN|nr:NUDIX domain-containing protein [Sphingomonas naphthae]WCT73658.1 NUDIX domain-containing protein [Sphingomonas naphthae]